VSPNQPTTKRRARRDWVPYSKSIDGRRPRLPSPKKDLKARVSLTIGCGERGPGSRRAGPLCCAPGPLCLLGVSGDNGTGAIRTRYAASLPILGFPVVVHGSKGDQEGHQPRCLQVKGNAMSEPGPGNPVSPLPRVRRTLICWIGGLLGLLVLSGCKSDRLSERGQPFSAALINSMLHGLRS
jgi:hypothetical protein